MTRVFHVRLDKTLIMTKIDLLEKTRFHRINWDSIFLDEMLVIEMMYGNQFNFEKKTTPTFCKILSP